MTLPLFLAAAAESTGASGPIEGLQQTFEHFGVEPKFILYQGISILIVMWVLYKFGIKPVIATMDERTQKISAGLKHAEEMQTKLAAAQQESAEIVRKASQESARIVEEARKSAKDYLDKQTQEASAKANDILVKAQQAIELEHKKMLADARGEITRLVVATTQRVLAKELTDADRTRYNDSAARELSGV
jgi:F-type H+-transporting ATPase subunit b